MLVLTKRYSLSSSHRRPSACLTKGDALSVFFVGGVYRPKPLHKILAGIITIESGWKDPLGETLKRNLATEDFNFQVDFGCAIKHGSFWVENEPKLMVRRSAPDEALLFFFLQLLKALQSIGTVPAIKIDEYAKVLNSYEE